MLPHETSLDNLLQIIGAQYVELLALRQSDAVQKKMLADQASNISSLQREIDEVRSKAAEANSTHVEN